MIYLMPQSLNSMGRKNWLGVLLLNLAIALGFYIDNRSASAVDISTDLANIIPICKKIDHPEWFVNDLYLNDLKDVEYYTPFFVEALRFFAQFTQGDYIQSLNIISSLVHFIYGLLWFLLFYSIKKEYWLALIMSLLVRGVIWPPGGELIGISGIWSIMPRTVYLALLPLPFLCYVYLKRYRFIVGGLILGLILNFHPLSGLGGILGYLGLFIGGHLFNKTFFQKDTCFELLQGLCACFIGMLPYLYVYLSTIDATVAIDPSIFQLAFEKRISKVFTNPVAFVKLWNRLPFYFYLVLFLLFCWMDHSVKKQYSKVLVFALLLVFIVANGSVYVEQAVNSLFGTTIRMSFQLIRFQKFILIFFQIGAYLLLVSLAHRFSISSSLKKVGFMCFFAVLWVADASFMKKIPFISDDICVNTLPYTLKFRKAPLDTNRENHKAMMEYVTMNTPSDAVFYGDFYIRAAANRSVKLDGKGAGMLIEGNLPQFIQWYIDRVHFDSLQPLERVQFLKNKKVTHVCTKKYWEGGDLVKSIGDYHLYKL
jgi:hypothetical protein